jgi:transcriptional antiterminator NusG
MSTPDSGAAGPAQDVVEPEAAETRAAPRKNSQWFVIHTYSGYENKVKTNLEKRVNSMGMEDQIFQVLVPVEETLEVKDGKKRTVQRKIFPGYVLVEMTMTDDSWYVVRNTPGVTGFVGSGSKPTPLQPDEVEQIMYQMGLLEARPRPVARVDVEVGENIRVRSGPFDGFIGVIDQIDAERGKLRVLVSMFGRETPLELDFAQIEKL